MEIAFGPVPSRRLGRSLGINHLPPKVCTYSCIYCQVGSGGERSVEPRSFYQPAEVARRVAERVEAVRRAGEQIDYLTFVPDGEPTLDAGLGETIRLLRPLDIPLAVISNASLVWRPDVAAALSTADWVSLKVDTVDEPAWRRLHRPHPSLQLPVILDGIRRFASEFPGALATETMLVAGINDDPVRLEATARYLQVAGVTEAWLGVPIRPTALVGVAAPEATAVAEAHRIFCRHLRQVSSLAEDEEGAFSSGGDVVRDLLGVCAVHPMREAAVRALLAQEAAPWSVVEDLIATGRLVEIRHRGQRFYAHRPARPIPSGNP
jgi:wyosine [tRNA(Phe)-imidazoG37] synthetase (radical SAM superfamily)